jgi:hypothetical protein
MFANGLECQMPGHASMHIGRRFVTFRSGSRKTRRRTLRAAAKAEQARGERNRFGHGPSDEQTRRLRAATIHPGCDDPPAIPAYCQANGALIHR